MIEIYIFINKSSLYESFFGIFCFYGIISWKIEGKIKDNNNKISWIKDEEEKEHNKDIVEIKKQIKKEKKLS